MAGGPNDSACHLLTIPAELRHQVYQHLFADSLIVLNSLPVYGKDKRGVICSGKRQCNTPLFQTCRQIRLEARPILIQSLTLRLESHRLNESHLPPILRHDGCQHLRVLAFSLRTECYRLPVLNPSYFPNLQHLRLLQPSKAGAASTRSLGATTISEALNWLEDQATDKSLIEKLSSSLRMEGVTPIIGQMSKKLDWLHRVYYNPERRHTMTMEKMLRLILGIAVNPSNINHRQCRQYRFIYQLDLDKETQHLHYITDYATGRKLDLSQCLALCHGQ